MKKHILLTAIFFYSIHLLTSCTRDRLPAQKFYYGGVRGDVKNLPGTPDIDIYLDTVKMGERVGPGSFGQYMVPAGKKMTLSFRNRNTGELLIDTIFTVSVDQTASFQLAWSEETGIKGFLGSNNNIARDSIVISLLNSLDEPRPEMDLYVVKANVRTLEVMDTVAIFQDFRKGKLTPAITVAAYTPDINPRMGYYGLLKDRQTGEFIILNPANGLKFFPVSTNPNPDFYGGRYLIGRVYVSNGRILTELIEM